MLRMMLWGDGSRLGEYFKFFFFRTSTRFATAFKRGPRLCLLRPTCGLSSHVGCLSGVASLSPTGFYLFLLVVPHSGVVSFLRLILHESRSIAASTNFI